MKKLIPASIALIVLAALVGGRFMKPAVENRDLSLRVAFPYDKPVSFYEPTSIHLAPEYFFLEYIYSPVVEIGKEGELIPGVAESFEWQGNDLHLKIRQDLKTASGTKITVDDVMFSLKRLIVKTGNTHGDFASLVCGEEILKSVDDPCSGIIQQGESIVLKAGHRKTFLLPMLAAIDFAVIPRSSVNPKTLKIENYHETSGPYYVTEDKGSGHITLKANPHHYHYSPRMPQVVVLKPTDPKDMTASLASFKNGDVDFITSIDAARPERVIDFSREVGGAKLHTTMNIRSFVLAFSKRGLTELTQSQRVLIGQKVKAAFLEGFKDASGYEESFQYFPSFADGGLSTDDISDLRERQALATGEVPPRLKLVLIRMGDKDKFIRLFKDSLPGVEISEGSPPEFTKYENPNDMPHMFLAGPDTGFLEDIGLISYSLSSGLFGMTKKEREDWLSDYMLVTRKEERLERLRALHKKVLTDAVVIPLMVAPYVALVKEGWELNFPQYYGNSPLWLIKAI